MAKEGHLKGKGETSLFGSDFGGQHSLQRGGSERVNSMDSTLSAQRFSHVFFRGAG